MIDFLVNDVVTYLNIVQSAVVDGADLIRWDNVVIDTGLFISVIGIQLQFAVYATLRFIAVGRK